MQYVFMGMTLFSVSIFVCIFFMQSLPIGTIVIKFQFNDIYNSSICSEAYGIIKIHLNPKLQEMNCLINKMPQQSKKRKKFHQSMRRYEVNITKGRVVQWLFGYLCQQKMTFRFQQKINHNILKILMLQRLMYIKTTELKMFQK